jgi:FMN phosphatase YigB (HAD superfamily)
MSEEQLEIVFQRIYSRFGSQMAYEKFDDALPFLNWSQRHNILCGVVSNADERYGDSILPMLGITPDTLQFACFSKDFGLEKPDPDFYHAAINRAAQWLTNPSDKLLPSQVLHIGNDFDKDFEGARSAGMHAVLLDRYDESQKAEEWGRLGAPVFTDLIDIVHWIGQTGCRLG